MTRRIFVALNLPQEKKDSFACLPQKFPGLPAKWVPVNNLHLTLAFLAQRDDKELFLIREATEAAAGKNQEFVLSFARLSYGPDKKFPPRLVWLEGNACEALANFKKDLDTALEKRIKFKPDKRKFLPHITLARIKSFDWRRMSQEERPEVEMDFNLRIPINSVEVMESRLKRSGAEYEIISSYALGGEKK